MNDLIEIYREMNKILQESPTPSRYFNDKLSTGIFFEVYPFTLLGALAKTEQEYKHHPEGNVWNHTMLVIDQCAKYKSYSEDARAFMWAGLLHDLGKATTTKIRKGRINSYDHDRASKILAENFFMEFQEDKEFIVKVINLVRWHMQILYVLRKLPFADIGHMLEDVSLEEIALLSLCDRLGRGELTEEKIKTEVQNVENFKLQCNNLNSKVK